MTKYTIQPFEKVFNSITKALNYYTDPYFYDIFGRDDDYKTYSTGTIPNTNISTHNLTLFNLADGKGKIELPGFEEGEINIEYHNATRQLKIEAIANREDFKRRICYYSSIPQEYNEELIEASYKNGILYISTPKKDSDELQSAIRKIQIK